MAVVHDTTMTPGKLELLAAWLPARPWFAGHGGALRKAGGFRLDDPDGEVGIEFMAVGDGRHVHQVPMTYRGAPLDGADHALIGTSEHGVLGRRWLYDGVHDPVFQAQLFALLEGRAVAQAQNTSDMPDEAVERRYGGEPFPAGPAAVADGPDGTVLTVPGRPAVRVLRVLRPDTDAADAAGYVAGEWTSADGGTVRGPLVVVR
ncbi:maltokinase N-terminal cap-like domain-containing protein [Actinomadura verrucosospora]|uniref:1,4-alpha-glucan branching protein n=1 Tax=Actinomadura verrucosospora TaxID=46165 RepID=A0A7D3VRF4_ACTVE|nr:1,4-alpha-glucan branching protein [Actinomadura verrucosospora]QKG20900.1 1,4-alpha-glucan branching protein [Actinomadura verrucosospora]